MNESNEMNVWAKAKVKQLLLLAIGQIRGELDVMEWGLK